MIRALTGKELRQHAVTFAFLFALLLIGLAGITGQRFLSRAAGTGLAGVRLLLITIVPLGCIMLSHVLVAAEFGRKTQLFLDALPLPRWRLIAVKYLLGFFILLAGSIAALAIELTSGRGKATLTAEFTVILVAKVAVWLLFIYSVFFAHSLLGRYRIPVVIASILILLQLQQEGVPTGEFAPFQLVDHRFAYEAHHFPLRELLITVAVSCGLIGIAFWLGLARDATLAGFLAKRMSGPEKAFFTFLTMAGLLSMAYTMERRKELEVVRMPGAVEVERGAVRVAVSAAVASPTSAEQAAIQRVSSLITTEMEALSAYLNCETLPPIFIVHRRDFASDRIENGELKAKQGLMLRANVATETFDQEKFLQRLVHEILLLKSSGRAAKEPNAWVLAGFPSWWMEKRRNAPTRSEDPLRLKQPVELSDEAISDWLKLQKTIGESEAKTLARIGLTALESRYGEEASQRFLRAMFAADVPKDIRGWLSDVTHPMSARLQAATGASLESFAQAWAASLPAVTEEPPKPE